MLAAGGVWSTAGVAGVPSGLLAWVEVSVLLPEDALPVSADPPPAAVESVAGVDGAVAAELELPVVSAGGAELSPALVEGSVAGVAGDDAVPVVGDAVGSDVPAVGVVAAPEPADGVVPVPVGLAPGWEPAEAGCASDPPAGVVPVG